MTRSEAAVRGTWPAVAAAAGCLLVLLAGEPIGTGAPAFTAGYVLRRVALALVTGALLVLAAWKGEPRAPRPAWWLLLPGLAVLLAVLALPDAHAGRTLVVQAAGWLALGALPLALGTLLGRPERSALAWRALATAAVALVAFGVIERLAGARMAASFGRPAIAGTVFGALLVPAFLFGFGRDTPARWIVPGLLGAGCLASGSRMALVAAIFGVLFAVQVAAHGARRRRLAGGAAVVLAALVVGGVGLTARGVVAPPGGGTTIEVRLGLYRAATRLVAERPLSGHGLGSYPAEALRRRDAAEAALEPGRRPTHAHMDALHLGVEGGVPAALALLVFVGAALFAATRRAREADPPARRALAAAVGALATCAIAGLGDGILVDPAPVLLAALAVATILATRPAGRTPLALRVGMALLGAGFLAAAWVAGVVAAADAGVQAHVNTRADLAQRAVAGLVDRPGRVEALERSAREHLDPAIALAPADAEARYQRAYVHAEKGELHAAARHLRAAFAADPGKTEARLDLAEVFTLQGRPDDAAAVLREATRRDPTRFEAWLRLGHVLLGPEPVPGDPLRERDWIPVLRAYNEARALAPGRFENDVALARVKRRMGDLGEADVLLETAARRFPTTPTESKGAEHVALLLGAPAEIVLEAFRVAEARGAADVITSELLELALEKDQALGGPLRREANRFLEEGETREARAREAAAGSLDPREFAAADRAFDAAAVRLAALLQTGLADGPDQLTRAREDRRERRFRTALARYRAILAWTAGPNVADLRGLDPNEAARWRMELLGEAASAAVRVDATLARTYYTRHFLLRGLIALGEDDPARAVTELRRALEHDDTDAATHFALARAHARQADLGLGAKALLKAIELDERFRQTARVEPDVAPLLDRPAVRGALR